MVAPSSNPLAHRRSLRPPQFGLRTLLALVTICGILLALRHWFDPLVVFALVFLGLSLFFHVAGNSIGTRLRQMGDTPHPEQHELIRPARVAPKPHDFAPTTQLSRRQSLGWSVIVAGSVGATSGAVGGGLWTFVVERGMANPFDIAIGVIAFAILGGIAAFAIVGFTQVLFGAYWQAMHGSSSPKSSETMPK